MVAVLNPRVIQPVFTAVIIPHNYRGIPMPKSSSSLALIVTEDPEVGGEAGEVQGQKGKNILTARSQEPINN